MEEGETKKGKRDGNHSASDRFSRATDTRFKTQSAALVRDRAITIKSIDFPADRINAKSVQKSLYANNQYRHLTIRSAHTSIFHFLG